MEREYKPGDVGKRGIRISPIIHAYPHTCISLPASFSLSLVIVSQDMDAPSLVNKLVEATPQWYIFGEYLDIPTFKLKELRDETSPDVSFSIMMDGWYDSGDATIEAVIEALENLHNRVLAKKVRDNFLAPFEGMNSLLFLNNECFFAYFLEQAKKQAVTWLTGVDEKVLSGM